MKPQPSRYIHIFTLFLTISFSFLISCRKKIESKQTEKTANGNIEKVVIYENEKIIYKNDWGNKPDSIKPKFDINFCYENFDFPSYFPERTELKGNSGEITSKIGNEHFVPALRTLYQMTYDSKGRISHYSIGGPSTLYSCDFFYDKKNRMILISDSWKKIKIEYNDLNNIEEIFEMDWTKKKLRFAYNYSTIKKP